MPDSSLRLVNQTTNDINSSVFGINASQPKGQAGAAGSAPSPNQQSQAKAVQSIGQTTAIVIQDAGDMLRNINAVETTAIGAATAAWIATKNEKYQTMIQQSMTTMQNAAALYLTIGTNAASVLNLFGGTPSGGTAGPDTKSKGR